MEKKDAKHEFAIYICDLKNIIQEFSVGKIFTISDKEIVHRIVRILRLQIHDHVILFDNSIYVHSSIISIGKREISLQILSQQAVCRLQPAITVLLPVLKRDHLDAAIYSLVEMGVNTIQLVLTAKTQRAWGKQKEFDRLLRIMIGAAEQSKNFALPELLPPKQLFDTIDCSGDKLFFDPMGEPLTHVWEVLKEQKLCEITLLVGPEGDLTSEEKDRVKKARFIFCRLTPTILRAQQAITLAAGLVRSLVRN